MKKENASSVLFPMLMIPFGGLIALGVCYMLYYGIYMSIETTIYQDNPMEVPAGAIRNTFAIVVLIAYLLFLRTNYSDVIKAAIGVGPMALLLIAAGLALYLKPYLAVGAILVLAACYMAVIYRNKKPWFYYYAVGLSVVSAIFYAWPRD